MPDLHAGKGCPIGAAFLSQGWIYPALVGNDIGCGMGLWCTGPKATKLKLDKWAAKLHLDGVWEGDAGVWLVEHDLPVDLFAESMVAIGGGNHFAELQRVETIYDAEACAGLGVERRWLQLLVRSGSRDLGHEILRGHVATFKTEGSPAESEEEAPQAYKNIDVVIQDMVDADLIRVLARLQPVLSYKAKRRQQWKAKCSS